MESLTELDVLIPSSGKRSRRRGPARKHGRRPPKYRQMIMRAIKRMKDPRGSTIQSISKFIGQVYKKRNDFVVKHVANWLVSKRVLRRCKTRFMLTGRKLKLGTKQKTRRGGKRKKQKRVKRKQRRRRRGRKTRRR